MGEAEEPQRPENAVRRSLSDPSKKPPLSQGTPATDAPAMQQGGLFERPSDSLTNTGSRQPSSWGDDLPNRQVMSLGGPGLVDEKVQPRFIKPLDKYPGPQPLHLVCFVRTER